MNGKTQTIQSFVGAMKIARNVAVLGGTMNDTRLDDGVPGSLSEGAAERSEAEGVSSDGSSGPMVYPQAIIDSEIFERLRSSGYTPSVSLSLDSSLREGAGRGGYHSTCRPDVGRLRAIFIAPTKAQISSPQRFRYRVGQGTYCMGTGPMRN